jgi:hypothetical protein
VKLIFEAEESNQEQRVPAGAYWQSRFFSQTKLLWKWLGDVESIVLADEIESQAIESPVYVCGLARSGTTIITEMLNAHEQLTCHRYSDFPNIYTPYWRNWLLQRSRFGTANAVERSHNDGIRVTRDSAEAVEELLWMYFFPEAHNPMVDQRLGSKTENQAFERFYRQHIAKLLLVRKKERYLAKGNYNISRIAYISKLFPDARFIVPVRHPVEHIVSLYKQHKLFLDLQEQDKRTATQLAMNGHYEFGPQRRCPNYGDQDISQKIAACWAQGSELQGWAWLWRQAYSQVKKSLDDPELKDSIMWLGYEDLCSQPRSTIDAILRHCDLPEESFVAASEHYQSILKPQDYYQFELEGNILNQIWDIVSPVAEYFGYVRPT